MGPDAQGGPTSGRRHYQARETATIDRISSMLVVQPVDATQLAEDPEMEEKEHDGRSTLIIIIFMQALQIAIFGGKVVLARTSKYSDFLE